MGNEDLPKVCFEIDGIPAINRTISTFKKVGFKKFVLVVGVKSDKVMDTVSTLHSGVSYVYQNPQLGTGHAAICAGEVLENGGHTDPILVCMGDKYIETKAIELLVNGFIRNQSDFALLTLPCKSDGLNTEARVVGDEKRPSGVVTFLFADIEGSTRLWEESSHLMMTALEQHDAAIDEAIGRHRGHSVKPRGEGDSRFVVFESARDAGVEACFVVERRELPRFDLAGLLGCQVRVDRVTRLLEVLFDVAPD